MKAKTVSVSMPEEIIKEIEKSARGLHEKFSEWMKRAALNRLELNRKTHSK
jgi:metal-responsive CopG/Arc/MetJ family transcriptional regulator